MVLYLHQIGSDYCQEQLQHIVMADDHNKTKVTLGEG
jgi:hypothetical protein